mmetsp:Transcript_93538/g.166395  ORF Transcript_93538/g.166395 Transcript_93538/m.166395 type:complete len:250 (-) Transcript_93538:214-963(-)
MSGTRDQNIFMARLCEQAERYDDMADRMRLVAKMGLLDKEERNLFSVAYKNKVGARRLAWRQVMHLESLESESQRDPASLQALMQYRLQIQQELNTSCTEVVEIIDTELILKAPDPEAQCFYSKMKGDYYRYLAEFAAGDQRTTAATEAEKAYQYASEIAQGSLPPTHPLSLGLALNFSVFYFEVLSSPEKACELARRAFDDAMKVMDTLDADSYQDAAAIMQLLRDNLVLWTNNMPGGEDLPLTVDEL